MRASKIVAAGRWVAGPDLCCRWGDCCSAATPRHQGILARRAPVYPPAPATGPPPLCSLPAFSLHSKQAGRVCRLLNGCSIPLTLLFCNQNSHIPTGMLGIPYTWATR